jgi:hypothetical protein
MEPETLPSIVGNATFKWNSGNKEQEWWEKRESSALKSRSAAHSLNGEI